MHQAIVLHLAWLLLLTCFAHMLLDRKVCNLDSTFDSLRILIPRIRSSGIICTARYRYSDVTLHSDCLLLAVHRTPADSMQCQPGNCTFIVHLGAMANLDNLACHDGIRFPPFLSRPIDCIAANGCNGDWHILAPASHVFTGAAFSVRVLRCNCRYSDDLLDHV